MANQQEESVHPRRTRTASALLIAAVAAAGCFGANGDAGSDPDSTPTPTWQVGRWWIFDGSDGITYTYRVEGRENKDGADAYRTKVTLDKPDAVGLTSYTEWFQPSDLGYVATERGEVYGRFDCSYTALLPATTSGPHACNLTMYRQGSFLHQSNATWSKRHMGTEQIRVGPVSHTTQKLEFLDDARGGTLATIWYAASVQGAVKVIGSDGITYQLRAWEP